VGIEEETTRFPLRLGIGLYARSVQADGAVRQDRKMIDVAFGHMSHDDVIFENLRLEVGFWHLLIPFDPKPLTSQIKKAGEFNLPGQAAAQGTPVRGFRRSSI
jgi:hypothetical protein